MCVLGSQVSCKKWDAFLGLTHAGPKNHVSDGGPDSMNPYATARGDKMAMRPVATLFWTNISNTMQQAQLEDTHIIQISSLFS